MHAPSRDQGFTLVEVIMVVSILGLLVGVLAAALRVGVHASTEAVGRLDLSRDAELLSHVLGDDLANAATVDTAPATCVAAPLLRLDVGAEVAYQVDAAAHTLTRHDCAAGTTRIVARFLGDVAPTIVCIPSCGSATTRVRVEVPVCARLGETDRCDPKNSRTLRVIARPRSA